MNVISSLPFAMVGAMVFGWAAYTKMTTPDSITPVLHYLFPGAPPTADRYLLMASALAGLEAAIALSFIVFRRRKVVLIGIASVLISFTLVLILLMRDPVAPPCGCLGAPRSLVAPGQDTLGGIIRNFGLLLLIGALMASPAQRTWSVASTPAGGSPRQDARRAFTLIEALIVIGIIAILISLVLVFLAGARSHARSAKALTVMRHITASTHAYSSDFGDSFPYLGAAGAPWRGAVLNGTHIPGSEYFYQGKYYPSILAPAYADAAVFSRRHLPPEKPALEVLSTSYLMAHGAFAAPGYWVGETPPSSPALFRAVRQTEVLHPSLKGLLVDAATGFFQPQRPMDWPPMNVAMVDGSAARRSVSEGQLREVVVRPFGGLAVPVLATKRGIAGRDFEEPPGP